MGLVRAALQRRPRERLRQPREPHGLDGQPLPRRGAARAARRRRVAAGRGLGGHAAPVRRAARRLPAPRRARGAVGVRAAGPTGLVDAEQPWTLAKAGEGRGRGGRGRGSRAVLGDLVEACRLVALAAAPFMPADGAAGPRPARPRVPLRGRRQRRPATLLELLPGAAAAGPGPRDGDAGAAVPAARESRLSKPRRPDRR